MNVCRTAGSGHSVPLLLLEWTRPVLYCYATADPVGRVSKEESNAARCDLHIHADEAI